MGELTENAEMAKLIASLLEPRDDIASAVANQVDEGTVDLPGDVSWVHVTTQGGSTFTVTVQ